MAPPPFNVAPPMAKGFHFDHAQAQILDGSIQWGLLIIDQTLSDDEDEQRLQVLWCFG